MEGTCGTTEIFFVTTQHLAGDMLPSQFTAETSQELRMLSSVTINCQITKIVMNSGSQLSEL